MVLMDSLLVVRQLKIMGNPLGLVGAVEVEHLPLMHLRIALEVVPVLVALVAEVVAILLAQTLLMLEQQEGRKLAPLEMVESEQRHRAPQELRALQTFLVVAVEVGVTLRRLVLVVLVVLPQGVVVAGVLPTVLILVRGAQVVMVLFASTLGKE